MRTPEQERQRVRFFENLNNLLAAAHKGVAEGLYSGEEIVRRVRVAFPVTLARLASPSDLESNDGVDPCVKSSP